MPSGPAGDSSETRVQVGAGWVTIVGVAAYRRPDIPAAIFHDDTGAVIDYGNRWRPGAPPDDAYSAVSNAERFRGLHRVADALIEHLSVSFVVDVLDDVA